jgi:integrase
MHAALGWGEAQRADIHAGAVIETEQSPTVRQVLVDYCAARIRRGGENGRNAQYRLTRYVLSDPQLADTPLNKLSASRLVAWRQALPQMKPSGINRLLNDLRAGITTGMPAQILPPVLRAALRAEPGATEAREIQTLPEADLSRLLQAAITIDEPFGHLIRLLIVTGARFSQIVRLRVNDVQLAPGRSRILVPASNKGRVTKPKPPIPVPVSDETADELRPIVHGRRGHEVLLLRGTGKPWRVAVRMLYFWHQALELAQLRGDLIPYALRHSSIVRMLNDGVPTRFVAAVHDTSIKMLEAHYAKFITNEVEDRIRATVRSFEGAKVFPFPTGTAADEGRLTMPHQKGTAT